MQTCRISSRLKSIICISSGRRKGNTIISAFIASIRTWGRSMGIKNRKAHNRPMSFILDRLPNIGARHCALACIGTGFPPKPNYSVSEPPTQNFFVFKKAPTNFFSFLFHRRRRRTPLRHGHHIDGRFAEAYRSMLKKEKDVRQLPQLYKFFFWL